MCLVQALDRPVHANLMTPGEVETRFMWIQNVVEVGIHTRWIRPENMILLVFALKIESKQLLFFNKAHSFFTSRRPCWVSKVASIAHRPSCSWSHVYERYVDCPVDVYKSQHQFVLCMLTNWLTIAHHCALQIQDYFVSERNEVSYGETRIFQMYPVMRLIITTPVLTTHTTIGL